MNHTKNSLIQLKHIPWNCLFSLLNQNICIDRETLIFQIRKYLVLTAHHNTTLLLFSNVLIKFE